MIRPFAPLVTVIVLLSLLPLSHVWASEYRHSSPSSVSTVSGMGHGSHCTDSSPAPQVIRGRLPNGLAYILHSIPDGSQRAELRLILSVGSAIERDDERGYAHYLEHLAFAGSAHFSGRSMVEWAERQGIRYGVGLNAYTTHSHTVYTYSVPHMSPAVADTLLLIQSDLLSALSLTPEAVEVERGIVKEEIRAWQSDDPFYGLKVGQGPHGQYLPIGTYRDIDLITHSGIVRFYERWYRAPYATLIVVGDFDTTALEQRLQHVMGALPRYSDSEPPQEPELSYDEHRSVALRHDDLAASYIAEYILPYRVPRAGSVTDLYGQARRYMAYRAWVSRLYRHSSIDLSDQWYLSRTHHLTIRAEAADTTLLLQRFGQAGAALAHASRAISDLELVQLREHAKRYMPLLPADDASELAAYYTDECTQGDMVLVVPEQAQQLHQLIDGCTVDELRREVEQIQSQVAAATPALMALTAPTDTLDLMGLKRSIGMAIQLGMADTTFGYPVHHLDSTSMASPMLSDSSTEKSYGVVSEAVQALLVPPHQYDATTIAARRHHPHMGVEELWLTNGLRLILKPTTDTTAMLRVALIAPGGSATYAQEEEPRLESMAAYLDMGLVQGVSRQELSDYMVEHDIALSILSSSYSYGLVGSAPMHSISDLLCLMRARMMAPELVRGDLEVLRSELLTEVGKPSRLSQMVARDPVRSLQRRMDIDTGSYLPLREPQTPTDVEALDIDYMADRHRDLLTRTEGTTIIVVGPMDTTAMPRLLGSIFGDLPYRPAALPQPHHRAALLHPGTTPDVEERMILTPDDPDRAVLHLLYHGTYEPSLRVHLMLKLTRELIRNRLIQQLRTEQQIVYSPYISVVYRSYPEPWAYYDVECTLAPANLQHAEQVILSILHDLAHTPVSAEELRDIAYLFVTNKAAALLPDDTAAWMETLQGIVNTGENLQDYDRYEELLYSITPEELQVWLYSFGLTALHTKYAICPELLSK